jgi:hypothetical protein
MLIFHISVSLTGYIYPSPYFVLAGEMGAGYLAYVNGCGCRPISPATKESCCLLGTYLMYVPGPKRRGGVRGIKQPQAW